MYVGLASSLNNFVHGDLPEIVTISDIVTNAAVEQNRFLGYNSNLSA